MNFVMTHAPGVGLIEMNECSSEKCFRLQFCNARLGYTELGTTWANEINFGMIIVPGSITQPCCPEVQCATTLLQAIS